MFKLHLVEAIPEAKKSTTLREIAASASELDEIDDSIRQAIGQRVVFLCSSRLYLFTGDSSSEAEVIDGNDGGVGVLYQDLVQPQSMRQFSQTKSSLAVTTGENIAVARFTTAIASWAVAREHRPTQRLESSIGELYPYVGVDLDQTIELLDIHDVLDTSDRYLPQQPVELRLV